MAQYMAPATAIPVPAKNADISSRSALFYRYWLDFSTFELPPNAPVVPQPGASSPHARYDLTFLRNEETVMAASYEDANLVLQLSRWSTEMGLDKALNTIFAESFDAEKATVDDTPVHQALSFGEVVGTLVKQGVLDRGLVLDLWWVTGLWSRVSPAANLERKRLGEARLYENFEALAKSAGA